MRSVLPCALLLAAVVFVAAPLARAQSPADSVAVRAPAPADEANQAPDPNLVPYETRTNAGAHVLALPATIWSGVAGVFREGVLWAEYSGTIERLQRRYVGPPPPPYGVIPSVSFGGPEGLVGGLSFFHNDVFGTGRYARISGRYGGGSTYSLSTLFRDPAFLGSTVRLGLRGGFYSDADQRFFERGNDTPAEALVEYAYRQGRAEATFQVPIFGPFSVDLNTAYKYVNILNDSDNENGRFPPGVIGFGVANMLSAGGDIVFDFSRAGGLHAPRTYQGSVFLLGYRYGHDVGDRNFAYHRVKAEWRQFVPIPLLAFDRRLAFRARLEKTHPPNGDYVPFYELATLGGPNDLRGYPSNRFRDEGYLLLNAEYRYPVWDVMDAVLFFDTGQVFQRYEDIRPADFHSNVGAGFRVYGQSGVAGRMEVAFGPEGPRLMAQIGTTF